MSTTDPTAPPTPPAPGGGTPAPPAPPAADPPEPKPDEPRTFTQDEVNAIATREKQEGRAAAERKVAEDLGVPLDEAKALVAEARQRRDAELTEAQRAQQAAEAARAAADAERTAAASERHDVRVERALLAAGAQLEGATEEERADKLARIRRLVTAEVGADEAVVAADVAEVKRLYPALFGAAGGSTPPAPPGDPGGTPPPPGKGGGDALSRGAERAKARFSRGEPASTT